MQAETVAARLLVGAALPSAPSEAGADAVESISSGRKRKADDDVKAAENEARLAALVKEAVVAALEERKSVFKESFLAALKEWEANKAAELDATKAKLDATKAKLDTAVKEIFAYIDAHDELKDKEKQLEAENVNLKRELVEVRASDDRNKESLQTQADRIKELENKQLNDQLRYIVETIKNAFEDRGEGGGPASKKTNKGG